MTAASEPSAGPVPGDSGADRYLGWVFAALFFFTAGLGYIASMGLAALAALAALAVLPMARPTLSGWIGLAAVVVLAAWASVTMGWSVDHPNLHIATFKDVQRLTGAKLMLEALLFGALVVAAARLKPAPAELAMRVLAFSLTGLAAILIVDGLAKAALFSVLTAMVGDPLTPDLALRAVARGGYVLAILVWPAGMLLRREGRNVLVFALGAGLAAAMALLKVDAPACATLVGVLVLAAVLVCGRAAVLATGAISVVYFLAAPWIVATADHAGLLDRFKAALPPSWDARLSIWSFAAARIHERPWLGWGLDASRTFGASIPLHTHDAALQVRLELGAPGSVIAAALAALLFWAIGQAREGRGYMAVASATASAYLTIGALSFGVWQDWWLGLGAVAFCACLALKRAIPLWGDDHFAFHPFADEPAGG